MKHVLRFLLNRTLFSGLRRTLGYIPALLISRLLRGRLAVACVAFGLSGLLSTSLLGPLAQGASLIDAAGPLSEIAAKVANSVKSASDAARASQFPATSIPATGTVEVAFSPNGGGEALVLKVIDSAQPQEPLDVMAYSFTSAPITAALLRAHKRGVRVRLIADHEHNLSDSGRSSSSKARAALSALANAGIEVRTTTAYAIHHDKVCITPRAVQTGSFNYSDAAQRRNSENVIVVWNNEQLVKTYRHHFARNFATGRPFQPAY